MDIDIKNAPTPHHTTVIKPSAPTGNIRPTTAQDDTLNLSSTTSQLQKLEQALAAQPIIDLEKVRQIKTEITHGDYNVDVKRVAEKMLSIEGMINARSSA